MPKKCKDEFDEVYEPKFRGVPGHADLFLLVYRGEISAEEYLLTHVIEALVNARGEGCYASNGYLGRIIRRSARQVIRMIRHLEELGVVQSVGTKIVHGRTQRVLETAWSRIRLVPLPHDTGVMPRMTPVSSNINTVGNTTRRTLTSSTSSNADHADAGRHEEDDMAGELDGFPPAEGEQTPSAKKEVLRSATSLANKHRRFCAQQGWQISRDRRNWEEPFATLIRKYGAEDVKLRLDWYHANWDRDESRRDKFHKVLYHGKEFLRSYPDLVKVMDLINKEKAQYDVKLDRKLKGVAETVRSWGWPTKAKGQIDAAVQLTFDALTEFQSRLKAYCENNPKKPGLVGHHDNFAHHLLDVIGGFGPYGGVKGLTESWLEKVHADKANWSDWNQELVRCVPKPGMHDKKFNEWGRQVADEWSGARIWDKLMGYLYTHKE